MRRLYPLCERLAASDVSLIIEGETGTGKEVLAESLHQQGPRAGGCLLYTSDAADDLLCVDIGCRRIIKNKKKKTKKTLEQKSQLLTSSEY